MNEVLKKYNNFDNEYFKDRKNNEERYDKLFQKSEIYLESIFKKIEALNFLNNSIVLVLSDHGISIGEKIGERAYGAFCYDYTIKTFGYLYSKELNAKTIPTQIRHIDYMPTILELLGIDIDNSFEPIDGKSLVPLIKNNIVEENIAYSETGNPLKERAPPKSPNTKSIRTSNWKLIYNEYDDSKELYNLKEDPSEENNLINTNLEIEEFLWNELQKLQM
jgi:arylsulfatase A-like enzyme